MPGIGAGSTPARLHNGPTGGPGSKHCQRRRELEERTSILGENHEPLLCIQILLSVRARIPNARERRFRVPRLPSYACARVAGRFAHSIPHSPLRPALTSTLRNRPLPGAILNTGRPGGFYQVQPDNGTRHTVDKVSPVQGRSPKGVCPPSWKRRTWLLFSLARRLFDRSKGVGPIEGAIG